MKSNLTSSIGEKERFPETIEFGVRSNFLMRVPSSLNALMHDGLNADEVMRVVLLNGQLKDVEV